MNLFLNSKYFRTIYDVVLGILQIIVGLSYFLRPNVASTNFVTTFIPGGPIESGILFIILGIAMLFWRARPFVTWLLCAPFLYTLFLTAGFVFITEDRALWAAFNFIFEAMSITAIYLYFEVKQRG